MVWLVDFWLGFAGLLLLALAWVGWFGFGLAWLLRLGLTWLVVSGVVWLDSALLWLALAWLGWFGFGLVWLLCLGLTWLVVCGLVWLVGFLCSWCSQCAVLPVWLCSTSPPGGNQVDGLPPA